MPETRPYVLLTGATGMVGAQLLARLMRRHVPVMVLVRDKGNQTAQNRIDAVLKRFESAWSRHLGRPAILSGELNAPRLGLGPADEIRLRECCGKILHSAASLSFRPADESADNEPFRTNVEGTQRLLGLCESAEIKEFHYVSTAYVCGTNTGVAREADIDTGQSFANDYERSKVQAEELLRGSRCFSSLTVYRPSIVIDSDGQSPFAQDRTIYGAFSLFQVLASKFGLAANSHFFQNVGFAGTERKNLVEATWVADVIDGVLSAPQLHGRTYHLTDAAGTSINEIEAAFYQVASRQTPSPTTAARTSKSRQQDRVNGNGNGAAKSTRSSQPKHELMDAIAAPYVQTFLPYFKDDPTFDRRNLISAITNLGLPDHPHVGTSTIARVAGVQLALQKRTALHATNRNELGDQLLATLFTNGQDTALAGMDVSDDQDWGIVITGAGGGDWRLDRQHRRLSQAGQKCRRRIYCDRLTWNDLIHERLSVVNALAAGRLACEFDDRDESAASPGETLQRTNDECVDQLLSSLKRLARDKVQEAHRD